MIRLERACENEVHKGCMSIKEVYHRCPDGCSACPDCNGTGTITRDPTHEELMEIAGRLLDNTLNSRIDRALYEITHIDSGGVVWRVEGGKK
jgi:hypothetical protein